APGTPTSTSICSGRSPTARGPGSICGAWPTGSYSSGTLMTMKIAIIGAGGVGGYFGARLAAAGGDGHFLARGAHLEALQKHGLQVLSPNGDLHVKPCKATDDPKTIGTVDLVFIAVKLWSTEEALATARPLVGPHTAVVSFQNGVIAADKVAKA